MDDQVLIGDLDGQAGDETSMIGIEAVGEAEEGGEFSGVIAGVGIEGAVIFMAAVRGGAAMITGDQADDGPLFSAEGQFRGLDDEVARTFIVFRPAEGFSAVVEPGGGLEPEAFGVAHAMEGLELVEEAAGEAGDLAGMAGVATFQAG
jgi:hypothetical protein